MHAGGMPVARPVIASIHPGEIVSPISKLPELVREAQGMGGGRTVVVNAPVTVEGNIWREEDLVDEVGDKIVERAERGIGSLN